MDTTVNPESPPPNRKRRWRRFVFLLALALVGWSMLRSRSAAPTIHADSVLLLDLHGEYHEGPPDDLLGGILAEPRFSLFDVVHLIRDAKQDSRIKGMIVRVGSLDAGWGKAQEIRDALLFFRSSNKPLIAYLEHEFTNSTLEYYVAAAASKVYLPPAASAPLTGLLAQFTFLGGLWEKLDVEMEVEQIGAYKSAGDQLSRKSMSKEHREMSNWLLDSVFEQLVEGIAQSRELDPGKVRTAIDAAPMTADDLVRNRFTDGVRFLREIREELKADDERLVTAADYHRSGGFTPTGVSERSIAVIYGVGPITRGESDLGGLGQSRTVGADSLIESFDEAANDDDVAAILFRVDSPGGSALASDIIWEATQRAREQKPVVVSMSDVAGSGGYYVSAGASRIVAQPGTITGSIGVVLSKPNVGGLLAKLGITTETMARGEMANLSSSTTSLQPRERERVRASMRSVYDVFVERVASGRQMTPEQVDALGQGRVFTGKQAMENGLVDELGGFIDALEATKDAAGIPRKQPVPLVFYPRPKPLLERLSSLFGAEARSDLPRWMRTIEGVIQPLGFADGTLLTLMPARIEIR